jgi:phage-related minor tail protein
LNEVRTDPDKNPSLAPPDVIGHSLGGALAQLISAEFVDIVGETVTFNSPGIDDSMVAVFEAKGGKPENVTHYIVSGDIVSLAGEEYLPGEAVLLSFSDLNPLNKHLEKERLNNSDTNWNSLVVDWLSSPLFHYIDPDYFAFLLAVASLSPEIAALLTTRGTTEGSRTVIGAAWYLIAEAFNIAWQWGEPILNATKQWTADAWNATTQWTANAWSAASQWTADAWNATTQWTADAWNATTQWTADAWNATTQWTADTWNATTQWTADTWNATTQWTSEVWDATTQAVGDALNNVADWYGGLFGWWSW